ncbi:hypothetical protein FRC03_005776, partial [Tulasnella sp. 419]
AKFCSVLLLLCDLAVAIELQQPLTVLCDQTNIDKIPRNTKGCSLKQMLDKINHVEKIDDQPYNRNEFGKAGCYNYRYMVGSWHSLWDGQSLPVEGIGLNEVDACAMEIDHVVALKEAWNAGAYKDEWNTKDNWLRIMFMNDKDNLVAVSRSANRYKSSKAFPGYIPKMGACKFNQIWITIKYRYGLLATDQEFVQLKEALEFCAKQKIAPLGLQSGPELDHTVIIDTHPVANMSELPITNHYDLCDEVRRDLPTGQPKVIHDIMLDELKEQIGSTDKTNKPPYERNKFGDGWDDYGPVRTTLLRERARTDDKGVKLLKEITTLDWMTEFYGTWQSRWDGKTFEGVHSCVIEIDHTVSLSHAWYAGAYEWSTKRRECFATDRDNLELLYNKLNSEKSRYRFRVVEKVYTKHEFDWQTGDQGFPGWLPWKVEELCAYVLIWLKIKYRYELNVDAWEYQELARVLKQCQW